MASLISRIERSISASSSSSGGASPSRLAWMVDAKTSLAQVLRGHAALASPSSAASHSTPSTVTLSLFGPPLRSACSTSSGTASDRALARRLFDRSIGSATAPHRPSRAQQHAVARLQQQRAGGVDHRLAGAAQAGEQHVAVDALADAAPPAPSFAAVRCRSGRACARPACRRAPGTGANRRNAPSRLRCPAARRRRSSCAACRSSARSVA